MLPRIWRKLVLFGRLLAACRFSLISALVGLALLGGVVQAQNLFADLAFSSPLAQFGHWVLFLLALFFVWAFPVHYGARRILEEPHWLVPVQIRRTLPPDELAALETTLRDEFDWAIRWTPRALGLVPFAAVALGLYFCDAAMDSARDLDEVKRAHDQIVLIGAGDALAAILFVALVIWRRDLLAWLGHRANLRAAGGAQRVKTELTLFARASMVVTALYFVAAYLRPHELAALFDRALLIPFLLGSLVLALSLLARLGHEAGWPVLAPIVVIAALVTGTNTHLNDVRLLPQRPTDQLAGRQIELAAAVEKWRRANGCQDDTGKCPAALIIAAEGGASRAAFMAATLAGEIIDRSEPNGAPGRKIFALSGVSGGAYGAVAIRAALADAAERAAAAPPCARGDRTWFGAEGAGAKTAPDVRVSWRSCLQTLVSGDYLSSGFIGLGFRDGFAPANPFGSGSLILDRAALLEQSWERHYNYVTDLTRTPHNCGTRPGKGLCRPFGYAGTGEGWLPLLLLNGTSVSTGRRIIASDLISTYASPDGAPGRIAFFSQAYDLFELMSRPCPTDGGSCPAAAHDATDLPAVRDAPDLRLSTAALLSARFPIISPPGVIRDDADASYGDRVVDGGYFENSGLTSALDLAEALSKLHVKPALIWVQNDPNIDRALKKTPPRAAATPQYGPLDESLAVEVAGMVAAPLNTVLATRGGHGEEAADLALRELARLNGQAAPGFFKILMNEKANIGPDPRGDALFAAQCAGLAGKKPAMSKVSMSWWLSASVQAELDAQFCDSANRRSINDIMTLATRP
ncbi:hypothetical protein CCR94_03970 [Rhodoblastus sphagnicola]|uniref:PNPLA domain-containing protein n=1 Tax=Rhodoblastus sphagnicola TaxID=333368 RepID=A0A2S6NDU2_9HYPH|nr:hypothetical protein [Rhodoblastus sphagnicola]MBB4198475.1 hypothetical protein [Rhodoblastus sphagnicola]PPQ32802.1 hypothetical protein CCR94_03970 [Rhodoblastus sphagnicola]